MKGSHEPGRHKPGGWWVKTPGQVGPADEDGKVTRIPERHFSFDDKARAKRFAGNIQGAKMKRKGFWTFRRVLFALAIAVILFAIISH